MESIPAVKLGGFVVRKNEITVVQNYLWSDAYWTSFYSAKQLSTETRAQYLHLRSKFEFLVLTHFHTCWINCRQTENTATKVCSLSPKQHSKEIHWKIKLQRYTTVSFAFKRRGNVRIRTWKGDVAVSPVVARRLSHTSPRCSPPTLLAERNQQCYYYRPCRKLAEPQWRSEHFDSRCCVLLLLLRLWLMSSLRPRAPRSLAFSFRPASSQNTQPHIRPSPGSLFDCTRAARGWLSLCAATRTLSFPALQTLRVCIVYGLR